MSAENATTDFSDILDLAEDAAAEKATMALRGGTPLPPHRKAKESKLDLIRLTCRTCRRKLRVKADRAGQKIKCPTCEKVLQIPRPSREENTRDSSPDFKSLATELAAENKSAGDRGTPKKRALPNRKYRRLIKTLAEKGPFGPDKTRERADALRALGQSQDARAYDWLTADLEHQELPIRQSAAIALGELGDLRAMPLLVALLDDPSLVLRKAAILSLGKLKDRRSIKPLLLFGLENPQMKFLASEAIVEMGADAVQTLIELLNDSEPGVVLEAIVLLGRIKDPRARRALTRAIESQQPLFQCHAIEALGQLADSKTIGPIARLLNDPNASVRAMAAAALARMSSEKNVVGPLVKALSDSDEDVVVHAACGLGDSGDKRAVEPLSRLLRSPIPRVRESAAIALGHLGDSRAVGHLLPMLDAETDDVPLKALAALRALKDPQVAGPLLRHLSHPHPAIRRRIVDVLGTIGDAEVAEQLEHLLRVDSVSEIRMSAARALGEIADPASVDSLKHAIVHDEFNVRCQAIGALGQIGDEECYNIVSPLLDDQVAEIRYHAASALGDMGNRKAITRLKDLLKDKNPLVVRGSAKALEKLGIADVDAEVKKAQRSNRVRALHELALTVKSWWPDSVGTKAVLGGSLAVLTLMGVVGLLVSGLAEAPSRVIVRGNVQSLCFTDDGTQIAAGRTLGLVELWDISSGTIKDTFHPAGGSKIVKFLPPERMALVGGMGIQLWSESQESPPGASGHKRPVTRTAVTPDRTLAATLSTDGEVMIWDLNTGSPRAVFRIPVTEMLGFAVSADGSLIASGNIKGQVTVRKTENGEKVAQLTGSKAIAASTFHPDGKTLATASADQVMIWNLETRQRICQWEAVRLSGIQYHPQGTQLVGLRGASLTVWDTAVLDKAPPTQKTITVPADQIDAWVFSRDGSKLAVGGSEDSPIWIYETASGRLLKELDAKP